MDVELDVEEKIKKEDALTDVSTQELIDIERMSVKFHYKTRLVMIILIRFRSVGQNHLKLNVKPPNTMVIICPNKTRVYGIIIT